MRQLAAVLPLAGFFGLWLVLADRTTRQASAPSPGARVQALFLAAAGWGAYLAALSEILTLVGALNVWGIGLGWLVFSVFMWWLAWQRGALGNLSTLLRLPRLASWSLTERFWLTLLVGVLGAILVVALVSVPNNTDSLQYHLARVAHWLQDASLAHYPTAYAPQLSNAIWAEEVVLHFRALMGNMLAANLVQWLSMVGSLVAVWELGSMLGLGRSSQLLSVSFLASLPAGILEASSTQTDYVGAFWISMVALFTVKHAKTALDRVEWAGLAFAVGLAILTKETAYPYLLPFILWLLMVSLRRRGGWATLRLGLVSLAIVGIVTLGYWTRNLVTFGTPLGSAQRVSRGTGFSLNPSTLIVGLTRQILMEYPTPSAALNSNIVSVEHDWERLWGQADLPFTLIWSWNHEDAAGSPLHMTLALGALVVLGLCWVARRRDRPAIGSPGVYALVVMGGIAAYSWLRAFQVYTMRQHLPFFVLAAPLVGLAASRVLPERARTVASGLLLLLAIPWVFLNETRPLVGLIPATRTASVFVTPRDQSLFVNMPTLRKAYEAAANEVLGSGCRSVGLFIDSHDPEYAWWWLFGAPESGVRIEVVDPIPATQRYVNPRFNPCAMVCTVCGDRQVWGGLIRAARFDGVSVFLAPSEEGP